MNRQTPWQRRKKNMLVVVPASESTWAVAFSRRLIPGALFGTKNAAIRYAFMLAMMAGIDHANVMVLGHA